MKRLLTIKPNLAVSKPKLVGVTLGTNSWGYWISVELTALGWEAVTYWRRRV